MSKRELTLGSLNMSIPSYKISLTELSSLYPLDFAEEDISD